MLSPEKRARLVQEFGAFRGTETLVDIPNFEALKDNYAATLEELATKKPLATDLTPVKYLTFRIMAKELSKQKPGVNADHLAQDMISTYTKTGDFMPPIVSAGFNKREARKAESNAVSSLRLLVKRRRRSPTP
ncbi:MAG TPA: hypothetical protein VN956_10290 [Pyrinomonadaceae bacterium]|nr:hypothetical protein [Pyrinomonadaceae bacterium]